MQQVPDARGANGWESVGVPETGRALYFPPAAHS
jgi:hypothetical protein